MGGMPADTSMGGMAADTGHQWAGDSSRSGNRIRADSGRRNQTESRATDSSGRSTSPR
jgi:hypothetical protein